MEKDTKVDIEVVGKIDLPKLDVSKYIGAKTTIVDVSTHEGTYGYYVKLNGAVLETVGQGENAIVLRASAVIGLQQDEAGQIGWGEDTKMDKFLKLMGVSHFNELKGKEAIIQAKQSKSSDMEFLTFRGL